MNSLENQLFAISAVDGRYRSKVEELAAICSEAGLIAHRIRVEAAWLLHLAEDPIIRQDLTFSEVLKNTLENLVKAPPSEACGKVKAYESKTNHDVKAVEYYLRDVLRESGATDAQLAFIHFACTSEDINNLSYAMMLRDCREQAILPLWDRILADLGQKIVQFAHLPMLSRTHGQTASPTTLGKELAVFAHRLERQHKKLLNLQLEGKMSGAVGNYNAHVTTYPTVDWPQLSRRFIEGRCGLKQNPLTTQIENHDSMVEFCEIIKHFNTILIGFTRDIWSYISIGYFKQQSKAGEVGSSTMPHKVNPIDFENAEGNLGIANGLITHLADKLPISRWQRDLSDSTVQRVLGTVFGHCLIAYRSLLKGLDKIEVSENRFVEDLDHAWEVLAEPVQTVMRRYGVVDAYERLKAATRGQAVTEEAIKTIIRECDEIPQDVKKRLLELSPKTYVGVAEDLALAFVKR